MARLILFNKPYGVLSQFTDRGSPTARATLSDHVTVPGVYPAGRLDRDSEGLLLLTDDGRLQARIADPRFKLAKTYRVQVEGAVDEDAMARLRRGVVLNDGPTLPAEVAAIDPPLLWDRVPPVRFRKSVPDHWLSITIRVPQPLDQIVPLISPGERLPVREEFEPWPFRRKNARGGRSTAAQERSSRGRLVPAL